jgi:hypothetical protein
MWSEILTEKFPGVVPLPRRMIHMAQRCAHGYLLSSPRPRPEIPILLDQSQQRVIEITGRRNLKIWKPTTSSTPEAFPHPESPVLKDNVEACCHHQNETPVRKVMTRLKSKKKEKAGSLLWAGQQMVAVNIHTKNQTCGRETQGVVYWEGLKTMIIANHLGIILMLIGEKPRSESQNHGGPLNGQDMAKSNIVVTMIHDMTMIVIVLIIEPHDLMINQCQGRAF